MHWWFAPRGCLALGQEALNNVEAKKRFLQKIKVPQKKQFSILLMRTFKWNIYTTTIFVLVYFFFFSITFFCIKEVVLQYNWNNFYVMQFTIIIFWIVYHNFIFHNVCELTLKRKAHYYPIVVYFQIAPALALYSTLHLLPLVRVIILFEAFQLKINAPRLMLASIFLNIGIFLFFVSFKTIGVHKIVFGNDYISKSEKLIIKSIYKYIRHPLVLGSYLISFSIIMTFCNDVDSLLLYSTNLIFLYLYRIGEEKRMTKIFGKEYLEYIDITGAYFPKTLLQTRSSKTNIIIYDNKCLLCNNFIRLLIYLDKRGKIKFSSSKSKFAIENIEKSCIDVSKTIVFYSDGMIYTKSEAIKQTLNEISFTGKVLSLPLYLIPISISDKLYDSIALNRYRFGNTAINSCTFSSILEERTLN